MSRIGALGLLLTVLAGPSLAADEGGMGACVGPAAAQLSLDDQIANCTLAIRAGRDARADLARDFFARAQAFRMRGAYDLAVADYSQAIRLSPGDAAALVNRGNAYRAQGKLDLALADYNRAIRLRPGDSVAFDNRGRTYAAKGDMARAIADFDQAIRLKPNSAIPLYNRGLAKLKSGDAAGGQVDIDAAKALDPNLGKTPAAHSATL